MLIPYHVTNRQLVLLPHQAEEWTDQGRGELHVVPREAVRDIALKHGLGEGREWSEKRQKMGKPRNCLSKKCRNKTKTVKWSKSI